MYCGQCGSPNPESNRFCGQCGAHLAISALAEHPASTDRPQRSNAAYRDPNDPARVWNAPNPDRVSVTNVESQPQNSVVFMPHTFTAAEPVVTGPDSAAAEEVLGSEPLREEYGVGDRQPNQALHGPSFLGLSEDPADNSVDYSYLYEDERPRRTVNWGLLGVIAGIVLVGFLGFVYWNIRKGEFAARLRGDKPAVASDATVGPVVAEHRAANGPDMQVTNPLKKEPSKNDLPQSDATEPDRPTEGATASASKSDKSETSESSSAAASGTDSASSREDIAPEDHSAKKSARALREKEPDAAARKPAPEDNGNALVARADALLRISSCTNALSLLREAADRGNGRARSRLGGLYATGKCVSKDRAQAYNWFTLARAAGERAPWIEHNRTMLWAQMSESERERVVRH